MKIEVIMTNNTNSNRVVAGEPLNDSQVDKSEEHSKTLEEAIAERAKWTSEDWRKWYKKHMVWHDWDNNITYEGDEEVYED